MRWFSCWFRRPRLTNISATFRRLMACSVDTCIAVPCTELKASTSAPISSSVSFGISRIVGGASSAPTRRSSATARGRRFFVTSSAASIRRVNGPTIDRLITKIRTASRKAASTASKVNNERSESVWVASVEMSDKRNWEPCSAAWFHSRRFSQRRSNTSPAPRSGVSPAVSERRTTISSPMSSPAVSERVGAR